MYQEKQRLNLLHGFMIAYSLFLYFFFNIFLWFFFACFIFIPHFHFFLNLTFLTIIFNYCVYNCIDVSNKCPANVFKNYVSKPFKISKAEQLLSSSFGFLLILPKKLIDISESYYCSSHEVYF